MKLWMDGLRENAERHWLNGAAWGSLLALTVMVATCTISMWWHGARSERLPERYEQLERPINRPHGLYCLTVKS